jgi:hypothetical protein
VSNNSEVIENVSTPVNTSAPDFGIAQPEAEPAGTVTPSQTQPQELTIPEE